jgi:hypothetical protein
MNVIATTFRELITTLRIAPESHRTDDLCRELVAWLARLPNRYALVALIHQDNLETYRWYDGAVKILSLHGIYLRRREHSQGKGWFIYAELIPNTVVVRRLHHEHSDDELLAA